MLNLKIRGPIKLFIMGLFLIQSPTARDEDYSTHLNGTKDANRIVEKQQEQSNRDLKRVDIARQKQARYENSLRNGNVAHEKAKLTHAQQQEQSNRDLKRADIARQKQARYENSLRNGN
jgi:hypothetical protein